MKLRADTLARTLGNQPGNVATPTFLAETAERIGRESKQSYWIYEGGP